jgi:hypothetical protein
MAGAEGGGEDDAGSAGSNGAGRSGTPSPPRAPGAPGSTLHFNLVFAIDLSASMAGRRLDAAKACIDRVVTTALHPGDAVCLLGFHSSVGVVLPLTPLDGADVAGALRSLSTGRQTKLWDAVLEALDQLEAAEPDATVHSELVGARYVTFFFPLGRPVAACTRGGRDVHTPLSPFFHLHHMLINRPLQSVAAAPAGHRSAGRGGLSIAGGRRGRQ